MFHINHKYEEINRQLMFKQEYTSALFQCLPIGGEQPVTVITYKCIKCPKHKQITLDGWVEDERV